MARRDRDNQRWTVGFGIGRIVLKKAETETGFRRLSKELALRKPDDAQLRSPRH
ncbi:MAG: hypothetical protein OXE82_12045 [Rhodobacter sp.]|nr:hypothetical protein [Rhodobacter sp.]